MKKLHIGLAVIGTPAATTTTTPAVYTESSAWANYSAAGGTVAHLNLPAGHYLASAQVVIYVPHSSTQASLACVTR